MRRFSAIVLDTCVVLAFVVIGRANHHASGSLAGLASTSWPFLTGMALGELATRSWRRPAALVPTGVVVWLSTVAGGLPLAGVPAHGAALALTPIRPPFP